MPKRHHASREDEFTGTVAPLTAHEKRAEKVPAKLRKAVQECCLSTKAINDSRALTTVAAAGETIVCLNDMSQGTSDATRIGDTVSFTCLRFKGIIVLPTTANYDFYRFTVILDRLCFGNLCTYGQFLAATTANTLTYQLYNFANRTRFVVLHDVTYALVNTTTVGASAPGDTRSFEIVIPLRFRTDYSGNAGTIGDIVRNSLCLLQSSMNGVVTAAWTNQLEFQSA